MSNIIDNQKPEFGNDWQIQQLKAHETFAKDVMDRKVDINHKGIKIRVTVHMEFKCVECGASIQWVEYAQSAASPDEALECSEEHCQKCKCRYEFKSGCLQLTENPNRGIIREAI